LGPNSARAKFIISTMAIIADIVTKMLTWLQLKASTVLFVALLIKKISLEDFKKAAGGLQVDKFLNHIDECELKKLIEE
jgi:hypothetical protein